MEKLPEYTQKNPMVVLQMANDQEEMLLKEVALLQQMLLKEVAFVQKLSEEKDKVDKLSDKLSEQKDKLSEQKDNVKQLLDDKITSLEGELLQIKAKTEAVCANRIVLEVGLLQWDRKEKKNIKGSGSRCSQFVQKNLADEKQLLGDSADQLQNLGKKQLVVADVDVIRDCGRLFNTYSSMAHYDTNPMSTVGRKGIFIGGKQPEAAMLSLVMLKLQQLGCFSATLVVLDEDCKTELCTLQDGVVL